MLEDLRDIHLPDPISWWPPAPGWWLLLGLLILTVAIVWWLRIWHKRQMTKPAHLTFVELDVLRRTFEQDNDTKNLLIGLSVLLRRVAMTISSRKEIASLTGDDWIAWLNDKAASTVFSGDTAQLFIDMHYRPKVDVDAKLAIQVCEDWLCHIFEKPRTRH